MELLMFMFTRWMDEWWMADGWMGVVGPFALIVSSSRLFSHIKMFGYFCYWFTSELQPNKGFKQFELKIFTWCWIKFGDGWKAERRSKVLLRRASLPSWPDVLWRNHNFTPFGITGDKPCGHLDWSCHTFIIWCFGRATLIFGIWPEFMILIIFISLTCPKTSGWIQTCLHLSHEGAWFEITYRGHILASSCWSDSLLFLFKLIIHFIWTSIKGNKTSHKRCQTRVTAVQQKHGGEVTAGSTSPWRSISGWKQMQASDWSLSCFNQSNGR